MAARRKSHVLTDLPRERIEAARVASLYRGRWAIEAAFGELEAALVAYNVLAAIKSAIRAAHGVGGAEPSGYYLAVEIGTASRGLRIAVPEALWAAFGPLSAAAMAQWLLATAARVRPAEFAKTKRGSKKPRPPRASGSRVKHVSTKKLLDAGNKL